MENSIYKSIAERTDGNIYIGVVGPVRSGKSTFITKFMQNLVIPNISGEYKKERAVDELPQAAAGKTIMTTEPKFVPEEAAAIELGGGAKMNVRLVDCVGYILPSSIGYIENEQPRMVKTPWFESEVPFNMAAEVGTQKVINDHSTVGLVITSDGSITDIPRAEYEEVEKRVVRELEAAGKPFVIILNTAHPESEQTKKLAAELTTAYKHPVIAMNNLELDETEIKGILSEMILQFPVKEINVKIPKWLTSLDKNHWLKKEVFTALKESASNLKNISEVSSVGCQMTDCEYVSGCNVENIDLGKGAGYVDLALKSELFYRILGEATGLELKDESDLMAIMTDLAETKKKYEKVRSALEEVNATGYGIVMPGLDELTLDEPEIVKQGGKYGVRLKAAAPSIHMMAANITTEVSPIVGSEKQSEELIRYLLKEFEENPAKIWESNIFGKSLHSLVNEGLHNKLYRMPQEARLKLQETIQRIINDGCNGLICIIL
ncbi:MAG: stage IV sporulation protein A [Oscillospiraceae bacterium]|jgi:stage IV sporulation protein A|nr:stage IV sporulation protein A [Oscillospiraceae bacterium]